MPHPALEDALLRLQRADEHLDALSKERSSFLDQAAGRVMGRFERHGTQYVAYIEGQPPRRWSPTVSDFANQLRSMLDNLVSALVAYRGGTVTSATGFPIAVTPGYWSQGRCRAMLRGLSRADKDAIKNMQPVIRRQHDPDRDPLGILRLLSDRDKHRGLYGCYVSVPGYAELPEQLAGFPRAEKDVVIMGGWIGAGWNPDGPYTDFAATAVVQTGPDPQMSVQGHPPFDVALTNGEQTFPFSDLSVVRQETEQVVITLAPHFA